MVKNFAPLLSSRKSSAFTILELLAVLVILGIILGVLAPNIFRQLGKGKIEAAKVQMSSLAQSLNQFNMDCGFFPQTEQGLDALITAPTVGRTCSTYDSVGYFGKKKIPKDPWNSDYNYSSPGQINPQSFDLFSSGPDGQAGTDDDVKNWE